MVVGRRINHAHSLPAIILLVVDGIGLPLLALFQRCPKVEKRLRFIGFYIIAGFKCSTIRIDFVKKDLIIFIGKYTDLGRSI